jgi:hypoxanthine-guanine phosphoribosyltransferase
MDKLPAPKSYTLNKTSVKRFLNAIEDDDVREVIKVLLDNTLHISYKEFLKEIENIVKYIITVVPVDRPVFVFVDSNFSAYFYKSNYWMFMLIKNAIKTKYGRSIKLITTLDDTRVIDNDMVLLMDDCIYSGIQMSNTIENMKNTHNKKIQLMLAVPYVSNAGLYIIYEKYKKNFQIKDSCTFLLPKKYNNIKPLGEYLIEHEREKILHTQASRSETRQNLQLQAETQATRKAEKLAGYYHHLDKQIIMKAYPVYFDHKVGQHKSSFPAVYAGIVPNYNNERIIYSIVYEAGIGLEIWKSELEQYKKNGVNDEKILQNIIDNINHKKQYLKKGDLKATIIPLLNNCENVRVYASKHIYESSCPVPPYKRSSTSKSSTFSQSISQKNSFRSLPNISRSVLKRSNKSI